MKTVYFVLDYRNLEPMGNPSYFERVVCFKCLSK